MQACQDVTVTQDTGREWNLINLYPQAEYQEVKGFGGAFTEAAAVTAGKLSKENSVLGPQQRTHYR